MSTERYREFPCHNCGQYVDGTEEIIECQRCFKECCVNCIVALVDDKDLCDECAGES